MGARFSHPGSDSSGLSSGCSCVALVQNIVSRQQQVGVWAEKQARKTYPASYVITAANTSIAVIRVAIGTFEIIDVSSWDLERPRRVAVNHKSLC